MNIKVGIIVPCFNENETIIHFLRQLCKALDGLEQDFEINVIDDASTDETITLLQQFQLEEQSQKINLISLNYNLGHQGAIYQGLLFSEDKYDRIIVMDGDGEDDPSAIRDLMTKTDHDIVFVKRGRRSESPIFIIFYKIYKRIFRFVTGSSMSAGNFSMISNKVLKALIDSNFIHYSANLAKLKARKESIVSDRMPRLAGKSKMNFEALVLHGVRSLTVYAEELLLMFLKLFLIIMLVISLIAAFVLYKKLFTDDAILGWASSLLASLANTALISIGFFVLGILTLNIHRKNEFKKTKIYTLKNLKNANFFN